MQVVAKVLLHFPDEFHVVLHLLQSCGKLTSVNVWYGSKVLNECVGLLNRGSLLDNLKIVWQVQFIFHVFGDHLGLDTLNFFLN